MTTASLYFQQNLNRCFSACINPPVDVREVEGGFEVVEGEETHFCSPDKFRNAFRQGYMIADGNRPALCCRRLLTERDMRWGVLQVLVIPRDMTLDFDAGPKDMKAADALIRNRDGRMSVLSEDEARLKLQRVAVDCSPKQGNEPAPDRRNSAKVFHLSQFRH